MAENPESDGPKTPAESLLSLVNFIKKLKPDLNKFRSQVDVFFRNYLSVLTGSSEEKRSKRFMEFIRIDLMCKKLNLFIRKYLLWLEKTHRKVSKIKKKLAVLRDNTSEEYNKQIELLNKWIKPFHFIKYNLLKNFLTLPDERKIDLNISHYIECFKRVVADDRMGNRNNHKVLNGHLQNMIGIFQSYKDIPLYYSEKKIVPMNQN